MVSVMGDNKLCILLVDFKTLGLGCRLVALWSRRCQRVKALDVGGLLLIIPLEMEVFLPSLLIAELGLSESVFKALLKASGEHSNVQPWVLGVFFEEVEP